MRKLKDKKVIFFDMGDTLLHFHNFKQKEKYAQEQGIEYLYQFLVDQFPAIKREELIEGFIEPWQKALKLRSQSMHESAIDVLLNEFIKHYDGYLSYPMCVTAFRIYYQPFQELMEVKKDTYDILKTLKDHDYIIAVLSNTPYFSEVMKECFEIAGIDECIDHYFFSYDIGIMKPKRDIFEYAMKRLNVEPSECIMVGDSLYRDMAPASMLGMDCIWVNAKNEDNYLEIPLFLECKELSEILSPLLEAEAGDTILLPEEVEEEEDEEEEYQADASSLLEDDFDISAYVEDDE